MTLAMSWDEWARHDATALAGLVRKGEVTAAELAAQVAAGAAKVDPAVGAVVELFEDVVADPRRTAWTPRASSPACPIS
jgi:amidase